MAVSRQVWPRRMRRLVQALAFVVFLVLIVRMSAIAATRARGDWLMRFSPLSGLGASISAWHLITSFWPAAAIFIATVLLGRFFCGWLCPLGATLDIGDRLIGFLKARGAVVKCRSPDDAPEFEHTPGRRFKYYLLASCLVGAFVGLSFFGLFDPLSIAVRSFVLVVHSYVSQGLLALCGVFGWSDGAAALRRTLAVQTTPAFGLHLLAFLVLLGLLALGLIRRRFWCRYLCPLGAIYALAAKPAVTKRTVSDACVECGRCARACPMSCISADGRGR
ncbi:MAG: 4Fe-4S binding protein [Planctomycetota bacterium]|jgi:polyferredoxin